MNHTFWRLLVIAIVITLPSAGCTSFSAIQSGEQRERHLLVSVQLTSDENLESSKFVLDTVRRVVKRYERLSLDLLVEDSIEIHYSGNGNRYAVDEFIPHLSTVESSQIALASSIKRISDYGLTLAPNSHLVAIIVTEGYDDPDIIANFQGLFDKIPPSVTVLIAGVDSKYRNSFSRALHPIRDQAFLFGQSISAMQSLNSHL